MILTIPYPPSVNRVWRQYKGRTILSALGRQFRQDVAAIVGSVEPMSGELEVVMELYPRDKRVRDIDNPIKAAFDALTHAGVWNDDSQVKRLVVLMQEENGGYARLHITEMRDGQNQ